MVNRRQVLKASIAISALATHSQNSRAIAVPDNLPMPKFTLGQTVRHLWLCTDDVDELRFNRMLWYAGEIKGLVFEHGDFTHPSFQNQWIYFVDITKAEETVSNDTGWVQMFAETELEAYKPSTLGAKT